LPLTSINGAKSSTIGTFVKRLLPLAGQSRMDGLMLAKGVALLDHFVM